MSAPPIGQLLREVRATCPTPLLALGPEFLELWRGRIHRPYSSSTWDLVSVLLLNREVAGMAAGREAEAFLKTARLNVARVLLRMGERSALGSRAGLELEEHDPDEYRLLHWLLANVEGTRDAGPLADWKPRSDVGRILREGCALLGGDEAASDQVLAGFAGGEAEENTPRGILRRQVLLKSARTHLEAGAYEKALQVATRAAPEREPEARRCQLDAALGLGRGNPEQRQKWATEAGYSAYRARRRAERLELLDYRAASRRWRVEAENWKALRGRLCGEDE